MGGQVSQLFSYRFTFVITRRVAARRMSKINGSHLELFPRTFAFFFSSRYLLRSLQHAHSDIYSYTHIYIYITIYISLFSSFIVILPGFIINVSIPRPSHRSPKRRCKLLSNYSNALFILMLGILRNWSYKTIIMPYVSDASSLFYVTYFLN